MKSTSSPRSYKPAKVLLGKGKTKHARSGRPANKASGTKRADASGKAASR